MQTIKIGSRIQYSNGIWIVQDITLHGDGSIALDMMNVKDGVTDTVVGENVRSHLASGFAKILSK